LSGLGVSISGALPTSEHNASQEIGIELYADTASLKAGPLRLRLGELDIETRFDPGMGSLFVTDSRARVVINAALLESVGVPYLRLEQLRAESSIRLRPDVTATDAPLIFELHQTLKSESNYGAIDVEVMLEAPTLSRTSFSHADTNVSVRFESPASLMQLFIEPYPVLAECWRAAGLLVANGVRVSGDFRWSGGELVPAVDCRS